MVARGADPAVDVPAAPAHFFRRIANLPLLVPAGALFPVASLTPLSLVESICGAALNTGADAGVRQRHFLAHSVFPEKFDAVIAQLEAEPPGVGLDPAALYESPSHAASAVLAAVARVAQRVRDGFPLHPTYVLQQQDFFDNEVMAPNALAGLLALNQPPNGLCLSHLEGDGDFLIHYGTLAFSCYGRCLAASRDTPTAPTRRFLSDVRVLADSAGFSSVVGTLISSGSLQGWLDATLAPSFVTFREMVGGGADSREQAVRDQHFLRYGTDDQKQLVVAALARKAPLRPRLPNLFAVVSPASPPGVMASHLGRLCRAADLASLKTVTEISSLFTLDGALKDAVRSLTAPGLVVATVEDKLARIEEFLGSNPSRPSASGGAPGSSRSTYANDVSILISQPSWRATEANLLAELGGRRRPLVLFEFLTSSAVLGARQLALGRPATDELKRLLALSKPLQRAIDLINTGSKTRHKLVADAFVADRSVGGTLEPTTDEEIEFHTTMPEEMSKAILRGAFDEIDFVQFLRLLIAVHRPNNTIAPYSASWYDPHFVPLITPHLERMAALLGLPSTLVPGSIPAPLPAVFGTLSTFATTIASQHASIVGVPSAFTDENLIGLARFTAQVFPEAARRFQFYYSCADPAGPLPHSLFEEPSAAVACLNTLQKAIKTQESMAKNNRIVYGIASEVSTYGSIEGYFNHLINSAKRRAPSPSPSRSDPPKKSSKPSGKEKVDKREGKSGPDGKPGSRSSSRGRDDDRGSSRSPSQERGTIGSRKSAVQHSADGTGFWYQDPEGRKVSPVYTYDVLEKMAGKSRHELDFPVILSSKSTPQARATLCGFEGKPGHEHASSSAHMPPYGDFAAKVHQLFGQPTSSRASTSARPRP